MKAIYRISESEYVSVMQLDSKPTHRALMVYLVVATLLFLLILFTLEKHRVFSAIGGLVGGTLGILAVQYVAVPVLARRQYRKYEFLRGELTLEISTEGIKMSAENGESKLPWKHMLKWRQSDKFILIYVLPKLFYIVPKTLADKGFDVAGLVEKLHKHIGQPIK